MNEETALGRIAIIWSPEARADLRAIERQDYDVLARRPTISKGRKFALALRAVGAKALPFLRLRGQPARKAA